MMMVGWTEKRWRRGRVTRIELGLLVVEFGIRAVGDQNILRRGFAGSDMGAQGIKGFDEGECPIGNLKE